MNKEIKLYGEIGTPQLNGNTIVSLFSELESSGVTNLTIHLHCYGGSVIEGNIIYNTIKLSPINVKIIIDGVAASMASIILLAANEVEIAENGYIMIHRPTACEQGDADSHLQAAKLLSDMEKNFAISLSQKSGLKIDEVKRKWLNGTDIWLNADEAVKYGFANRIIQPITIDLKTLDKKVIALMSTKDTYNKYAASLNIKNQMNMKQLLITTLKLQGVTAESTDKDVMAKIVELIDGLKNQNTQETESTVNAILDTAIKTGTIQANAADTYRKIGKTSGVAVLNSLLSTLGTPAINIASLIKSDSRMPQANAADRRHNRTQWTLEDYRRYAPNELKANPQLYNDLYNAEYGTK